MLKMSNNASSLLATGINTGSTTLAITSGDEGKFPTLSGGEWHPLTLVDAAGNIEIMRCTARSGVTLTVTRAQEGTAAQTFAAGSRVEIRMTAAAIAAKAEQSALDALTTTVNGKLDIAGGNVGGSAATLRANIGANSATNLTAGTLPDARLPARLSTFCTTITDWNSATTNGFYMGNGATNGPPGGGWAMGLVLAHNANYHTQEVHRFTNDASGDTETFRRENNNGTWGSWYRIRQSEAELDARYAAAAHTHTFASLTSKPTTLAGYGITDAAAKVQGATAWVNFNGTGTPAIRDSYNVSSITDHGNGEWSINFTSAMANANYVPLVVNKDLDSAVNTAFIGTPANNQALANTMSTSAFRIHVWSTANSAARSDSVMVGCAVFGGL